MCETSPEKNLLSAEEVARDLGTTPLNVLLYIKRGQLAGQEIEGKWYVEAASLVALKSETTGVGSAPCKPACGHGGHGGGCGGCH
ncbi:MAG: hypothetical protein AB7D06_07775 [Pedobacter sp.]